MTDFVSSVLPEIIYMKVQNNFYMEKMRGIVVGECCEYFQRKDNILIRGSQNFFGIVLSL